MEHVYVVTKRPCWFYDLDLGFEKDLITVDLEISVLTFRGGP